jgi:hypothetical protein
MSTDVTMQELELEQAELLPSRETLCVPRWNPCCYYSCQPHHWCYDSCHQSWCPPPPCHPW